MPQHFHRDTVEKFLLGADLILGNNEKFYT